jgi:tetratricopeptide (TPR) repeat protein
MLQFWICVILLGPVAASDALFDLAVRLHPAEQAAVALFGTAFPFTSSTESDAGGQFRFHKLRAGAYTLVVVMPDRGEARRTVEIGPSLADARGHVSLDLTFKATDFVFSDSLRRRDLVSKSELAITATAQRDYIQAHRDLARHDVAAATRHLEEAIALSPQFEAAWNELGTLAYQTQKYVRAEECFREALKWDPRAYEPLVNLGGVLVTMERAQEAWQYNTMAVAQRPNDALAQSQLGMNYFQLGNLDLSLKHLEQARAIDPAHFSHPQIFLAEIRLRRGEKRAAADLIEEFLRYHPDWPYAARMRESVVELRK